MYMYIYSNDHLYNRELEASRQYILFKVKISLIFQPIVI